MIESENKKQTFHNLKIKTHPHKTLNSSKWVLRNKELSHCSREEILAELKKTRHNWYKKNYHQTIQTNTYISTFNSLIIPKEIKISYINEQIEQYIPNPLRCFKCQKFGYNGSVCNGHTIWGKWREREPNHTTIDCKSNNRYGNLLSFLLRCGTRPYERGTQWDSNSLVLVEIANHYTTRDTSPSTTDMPTVVKTTHPIPEHAQFWKRKKNRNYKTHQKYSLSRTPKNSWRLHKKTKPTPKSTQNQSKKGRKLPLTNL